MLNPTQVIGMVGDYFNSCINDPALQSIGSWFLIVISFLLIVLYIIDRIDYNRRKKQFSSPVYRLVLLTEKSDAADGFRYHPDRIPSVK